ncbi:hypothetical protein RCL1_000959 [Eukaryota sp. TZLM3-RCL]
MKEGCPTPQTVIQTEPSDVILASVHLTQNPLCYVNSLVSSWSRLQSSSTFLLFIDKSYTLGGHEDFLSYLRSHNVTVVVEDYHTPKSYGLLMSRFIFFFNYLKKHQSIRRVLMVDSRDVVFHSDPFPFVTPQGFFFTYEGCSGDHYYNNPTTSNGMWVKRTLGRRVFKMFPNSPIANCGVMGGDRESVIRVLRLFRKAFRTKVLPGRHLEYGVDMAILNALFHTGEFQRRGILIEDYTMKESSFGVVLCATTEWNRELNAPTDSQNCPLVILHHWRNNALVEKEFLKIVDSC